MIFLCFRMSIQFSLWRHLIVLLGSCPIQFPSSFHAYLLFMCFLLFSLVLSTTFVNWIFFFFSHFFLQSAVKLERREARQVKKEMKGLYKSESNRAQKVAAFTGPSSIHLMWMYCTLMINYNQFVHVCYASILISLLRWTCNSWTSISNCNKPFWALLAAVLK